MFNISKFSNRIKALWNTHGALLVTLILCIYYICFLSHEIQIERGDLGRFIAEGELILKNKSIINTNYYSFTYPNFEFPNHHWGTSIIFYTIYSWVGFSGIHVFSIILSVVTLLLLLQYAFKRGALPFVVLIVGLLSIPLISLRHEIRPEIFTSFFTTIFFIQISKSIEGKISIKRLLLLLVVYVFWVNIHSYHFLAIVISGSGLLHVLANYKNQKSKVKGLLLLTILLPICSLLNPSLIKGALIPYQFMISDSSFVLNETRTIFSAFNYYKEPLYLFVLGFIIVFLIHLILYKSIIRKNFYLSIVAGLMVLAALKGIRNISLMGWFFIPFGGVFISQVFIEIYNGQLKKMLLSKYKIIVVVFFILMLPFLIIKSSYYNPIKYPLKIGVRDNAMNAIDFFKENRLQGPIFNNYSNAGYLIYGLFPSEKVYTLNKFECYPDAFFEQEYFPALYDFNTWSRIDNKYNLNVIFFNLKDEKIESLEWLGQRLEDTDWALVYHEIEETAILVKRNEKNSAVIRNLEILPNIGQ